VTRWLLPTYWNDSYVAYELTLPDEKLLYAYLINNRSSNYTGIYEIDIKTIAGETGIPIERAREILAKLIRDGKIRYDEREILLLNFLEHNWVGDNPKYHKNMADDLKKFHNKDYVAEWFDLAERYGREIQFGPDHVMPALSKGVPARKPSKEAEPKPEQTKKPEKKAPDKSKEPAQPKAEVVRPDVKAIIDHFKASVKEVAGIDAETSDIDARLTEHALTKYKADELTNLVDFCIDYSHSKDWAVSLASYYKPIFKNLYAKEWQKKKGLFYGYENPPLDKKWWR
jgi:hypothetical protein